MPSVLLSALFLLLGKLPLFLCKALRVEMVLFLPSVLFPLPV